MKRIITMIIEDGTQATVEATACSNEGGNVFITASTLPEAQALIATGAAQLTEAMKDWQPVEEEPEQDQKHYYVISRSMEEMQEAAQAYEESPEGQRFTKSIENAIEFTFKHSNYRKASLRYLIRLKNITFRTATYISSVRGSTTCASHSALAYSICIQSSQCF